MVALITMALANAGTMLASGNAIIGLCFFNGAGLFGTVWIFVPPFHMPSVLAVDPTRRGAMFVGTAQLSGAVIGPLIATSVVASFGIAAVAYLSTTWLCLSALLLAAPQIHRRVVERVSA